MWESKKEKGIVKFVVSLGPFIVEASRSHTDKPLSVGVMWTGDKPDAVTRN
jgi:hypothetical protein